MTKVFNEKEAQIIKNEMRVMAKSMNYDSDIEEAYNRFEFVLGQMRKDIRVRFIDNVQHLCRQKTPQKTEYDHYAYYAVKMEEWFSMNFIIDVTKHGNIIFLPRFPEEEKNYFFKSGSDKIWSRETLEKAMAEAESEDASGSEACERE